MFFKYFFKAWVAIFIVTHAFDITMAVFDVAQHIMAGAAGVIHGSTAIDINAAIAVMPDKSRDEMRKLDGFLSIKMA